jgi:hypothetical protein
MARKTAAKSLVGAKAENAGRNAEVSGKTKGKQP